MTTVHKTSQGKIEDENEYKEMVELPQIGFTLKANSTTHELEIQKLWDKKYILNRVANKNTGDIFTPHVVPRMPMEIFILGMP